jgi:prepilin-type N-terminal cleavage/methylation domain-containing protein
MTSSTTTSMRSRARRGFTLIEIIMAMTILGVIGAALVRLIIMQARFTEGQMALRSARTVSRNAMNIMLTDLRMVQDKDGLIAADSSSVTVRVPVDFGLLCSTTGATTISLLPADSAMTALGVYAGWAYRDSASGEYRYKDAALPLPISSVASGAGATCTGAGISSVTVNGRSSRIVSLVDLPTGTPSPGWPAFIYQQITYKFDSSTTFRGRLGLYRIVKTSNPSAPIKDEIIAPFDRSARFRFYALNSDQAQDSVPTSLNSVRGLELVLAGSSVRVPEGGNQNKQATMVTGVFFKNRRDP